MDHPLGLRPTKIIAVHINYRSRAAERGGTPETPSHFLKPPSTLSADGADLVRPQGCELMVFEGEIAVVIGVRAHRVSPDKALDHVAGYAPANDVGVLDFRAADRGSNVRAKGQDGFTPLGSPLLDATGTDADSTTTSSPGCAPPGRTCASSASPAPCATYRCARTSSPASAAPTTRRSEPSIPCSQARCSSSTAARSTAPGPSATSSCWPRCSAARPA